MHSPKPLKYLPTLRGFLDHLACSSNFQGFGCYEYFQGSVISGFKTVLRDAFSRFNLKAYWDPVTFSGFFLVDTPEDERLGTCPHGALVQIIFLSK